MQITAIDGAVHNFNAARIHMVASKRAADTDQRFYLHGVAPEAIAVAGDPASFVSGLADAANFAQLTLAVTSLPVWVRGAAVRGVRTLTSAEQTHHAGANAVASFAVREIFVVDTTGQAMAAINGAGGAV